MLGLEVIAPNDSLKCLDKLVVSQLVEKFPVLVDVEHSSQLSRQATAEHCLASGDEVRSLPALSFKVRWLSVAVYLQVFSPEHYTNSFSLPCLPYATPILRFLVAVQLCLSFVSYFIHFSSFANLFHIECYLDVFF